LAKAIANDLAPCNIIQKVIQLSIVGNLIYNRCGEGNEVEHKEGQGMGKYFGSATVGSHGQIVIPSDARKELVIELGTKLLVFAAMDGRALLLIKAEAVHQVVSLMSRRLAEFERLVAAEASEG
jgi:AbrB family looped-hinge helix DNA binding protein